MGKERTHILWFFIGVFIFAVIAVGLEIGDDAECPEGYIINVNNSVWTCVKAGDIFVDNATTCNWLDYTPSSYTLSAGSTTSAIGDLQVMYDGLSFDVTEEATTPGMNAVFNITGMTTLPQFIVGRWRYDGSTAHSLTIDIYNQVNSSWDQVRLFSDSSAYFDSITMMIPLSSQSNYNDSEGNAQIRFYHHTTGNPSHDLHIDYIGLSDGSGDNCTVENGVVVEKESSCANGEGLLTESGEWVCDDLSHLSNINGTDIAPNTIVTSPWTGDGFTIGGGHNCSGFFSLCYGYDNNQINSLYGTIIGSNSRNWGSTSSVIVGRQNWILNSSYASSVIIGRAMMATSSGDILIGQGTGSYIHVNRSKGFSFYNDGDILGFNIDNESTMYFPSTYSDTVGTPNRDLYIDFSGKIGYVSSSEKYKKNIKNKTKDIRLMDLKVKEYDRIDDSATSEVGLIAEEVEEVFPELVSYKVDEEIVFSRFHPITGEPLYKKIYNLTNEPETVLYSQLPIHLLSYVQDLENRLSLLEQEVLDLKNKDK